MKIEILKYCVVEVCVGFDINQDPIFEEDCMSAGDRFDVEPFDESIDFEYLQFGDGSVGCFDKTLFKKV